MNYVNLPEGIRLMRNKAPGYEEQHEFKWRDSEHTGPGVRFVLECADFSDLQELDGDDAWSQVRHFWQQVYGNGLWHPAFEDNKSPKMRTEGVYVLYAKYVRGMLGPEAAAMAIALAKAGRWDFQLLDGMTFLVNLIHKKGLNKEGNETTYVNLAPFVEGDAGYDFERPKALCAVARDFIDENVKVLDANIARLGGTDKAGIADKYLKTVLIPIIKRMNEWDKEGVAQTKLVRWHTGVAVDKRTLIAEVRNNRGGWPFKSLTWDDQVLVLSELVHAISFCGEEIPDPPSEIGGGNLWFNEPAISAPVWPGYEQYDPEEAQ